MIRKTSFLKIFLIMLTAASLIIPTPTESSAAQNIAMKIGVADSKSSGTIMGEGLIFADARGNRGNVRNGAVIRASGGGLSVGNAVLTLPVTATANSGLGWDGTRYRGRLVFIRAGSGFTVVNEIDLESYLRGVIGREMGADWPLEALKAQAVLARTYAIKNRGRFSSRGYDLDAGENSQVYGGVNSEDPRTDRAVTETAGMILTWNGQPAEVFYHSDSGGSTADSAHVWGGSIPYLKVREEVVNYTSPNSTWQTTLSPSEVASILSRMNRNVGSVRSIGIAEADSAGRAIQMTFTGDGGSVNVKAHDFRMAAGPRVIRSTNLQVSRAGGAGVPPVTPVATPTPNVPVTLPEDIPPPDSLQGQRDFIEMTRAGIFTSREMLDMVTNPEKREEYRIIGYGRMRESAGEGSAPVMPPPAQAGTAGTGDFIFTGRGWGHGVGLSQWGARAMAENGMKHDAILIHYFPGTAISK